MYSERFLFMWWDFQQTAFFNVVPVVDVILSGENEADGLPAKTLETKAG